MKALVDHGSGKKQLEDGPRLVRCEATDVVGLMASEPMVLCFTRGSETYALK